MRTRLLFRGYNRRRINRIIDIGVRQGVKRGHMAELGRFLSVAKRCAFGVCVHSTGFAVITGLAIFPASAEQPPADQSNPPIVAQATRDALFGDDLPKDKPASPAEKKPASPSRESLFGDDLPKSPRPAESKGSAETISDGTSAWRGYLQTDLAYTYGEPEHWSKARARLELGRHGVLSSTVKYKITGRFDYDAVFDIEQGFYPSDVRKDRRRDFELRETYLDIAPGGDWEFRLGRQHIVWGEVPGLFFADVVSAKDLREFVLPEFDALRIPQWAARAEYFQADTHFEAVWIPWPTVDRIGKPGNDFYPYPPVASGFLPQFQAEQKPSRKLSNSNLGLRMSTLQNGWDLSAFAYRAFDNEATFYRDVVNGPVPTFVYTPQHGRITQLGGTVTKDLGDAVLKMEVIGTRGKGFSVQGVTDIDGVAKLDLVDYLVGLDFTLPADSRMNVYFFQRYFTKYETGVVPDRTESGLTLLLSHKVSSALELQALFITSLNRSDWIFRPKATWNFAKNWRLNVGADVLHGPQLGFFGRYAEQDRVYADLRYSF